ncbi:U-BOX DOMAIN-CONTAINING PROTEIN 4-LIKE ISOFORM X1 [Salix koriyanagi]|uniref:RING-type E3 ubiquitin transferase n=1 Tax=Salix koriyanagi TaxID=2511006 RepID=A0A9Q0U2L6_9ROSI|nr:U-BOX DOMAIN-CONTAINING PROTEIN 4-LIKE ISOFORM X1 [Salix koriyanagi]
MEKENSGSFEYMGRSFSELSVNDDSSAFSDCNSDRSGEFQTATSQNRRLLLACAAENSDDLICQLVSGLESCSIDEQKQAAMEIRLLAKNKPNDRFKIAKAGAIKPLISLILSSDSQLQEYGVTAILNLSLCDENKELIASSGAIKPLVRALKTGTSTAKENAACALLRLSQMEENKVAIGRSGAIPMLINLLATGAFRGKKDAATALYSLCSVKENKIRAVQAGIMKPLVELMADFGSNMVDKSAFVLSLLITVPEAKTAVVEEAGIPVLVEIVEVGSQRQKEIAVSILLQICEDNLVFRAMVTREGAIPPLVALTQSGTNRAKQKVSLILNLRLFMTESCLLHPLQLTWHACFGNQCRFGGYLFECSRSLFCHVSHFSNCALLFCGIKLVFILS